MDAKKNSILEKIAKEMLGIPTLETRNNGDLDFHTVSVWNLRDALEKAFIAGGQWTAFEMGQKASKLDADNKFSLADFDGP